MITVSNDFKNAIKNPERKIKGYVEILYTETDGGIFTFNANFSTTYYNIEGIFSGLRVNNGYGSLDYLPLDGSKLTMNIYPSYNGIVSDDLFEDIQNPQIQFNFSEYPRTKGFTLYFYDNKVTDLTLQLGLFDDDTQQNIQETIHIENNDKECIQIIFDEEKKLHGQTTIIINNMEYPDRKIHFQHMDLGITQVYQNQDLIEFTVDEEVNKLVEEVPINETNITLNNMSDLFNPLNPSGIVPYLSENSLIIPYVGILTENLGIEYVKMGEFYFDSYTNNSDSTTTLVGKNIIKQIEQKDITDGLVGLTSAFVDRVNDTSPNLTQDIINRLGYDVNFSPRQKIPYYFQFLDDINAMNYLKNVALHDYSIIYANRNNTLIIRNPVTDIVENLSKQELIEDAQFKKIERINIIKRVNKRTIGTSQYSDSENMSIFSSNDNSFIMEKTTQNFAIKNDSVYNAWNSVVTFTFEGVTNAQIMYGSNQYTFIQATGSVGSTAKFNCVKNNYTSKSSSLEDIYTVTNKAVGEKEYILEITNTINGFPDRVKTDLGQLEYTPSYEMNFDYNGNPSLEAGDYINVETPYGYKPLFIQKHRIKFDGGLEGTIEGVE